MAKIRIDEGELLMAMDSGDGTEQWYLDRQTGAVIWHSDDDALNFADDEDLEDDDEDESRAELREDRYLSIPALGSHEGFRIMEDFADSVDDARIRGELFDALDRRRPFRSFKDALLGHPEVREQWFKYHESRLREEALSWLRVEEIDAELLPHVERDAEQSPPP